MGLEDIGLVGGTKGSSFFLPKRNALPKRKKIWGVHTTPAHHHHQQQQRKTRAKKRGELVRGWPYSDEGRLSSSFFTRKYS
jgi:hypothetical protein